MRRLFGTRCVRQVMALGCFAIAATSCGADAQAQSFFERLFGGFSSSPPKRAVPAPRPPVMPRPLFAPYSSMPPLHPPGAADTVAPPRSSPGQYRTVCVRLCDGYYFPISSGVSAYRFGRDANICRSRCGAETRLFSMPASAPRIETALDQNGMRYAKLRTAFLYRKKRVAGCSCRPQPWSQEERARHASYAAEQQRRIAERERQAAERRALANGVTADAADALFGQHMAEVLPPAPEKTLQELPPAPLTVAMKPPAIAPEIRAPVSTWTLPRRPVISVFQVQRPERAVPVVRSVQPSARRRSWRSRVWGTDPRTSPMPDGP